MSFNPWSEDHHPTESFMKIVRETQIEPNRYYLETIMHQSLYENFAVNSYTPKVTVIKQQTPQEGNDENRQTQSPCLSNWSDYLHAADDSSHDEIQNKQNNLLINPLLQLVQEYLRTYEQTQILQ